MTAAFPIHSATSLAAPALAPRRSIVHKLALAIVWLTMAASGIVFAEPAPVDLLLMGLVLLLPLVGLAHFTPSLVCYLAIWLVIAATGLLAAPFAAKTGNAVVHTLVTLYLSLASVVLAAFVARKPKAHGRLILDGLVWAAVAATVAALAGYFALLPGAADLFTRFGRASGTFKDPNVYGAFLVLPVIYCLAISLERSTIRALVPMATAALLSLGVLLSFSRGAWINLALALLLFAFLALLTAPSRTARLRIVLFAGLAVLGGALVGILALQDDKVGDLLAERATLTQSYDVGTEGRFGGQQKALRLIAENPLGIGAQEFAKSHHPEEAHNVYLSMALNAGWLGGGLFLLLNALTVTVGWHALLSRPAVRPLMAIALSAFIATVLEGIIIDTDHWRHLFVEMALVWGLAAGGRGAGPAATTDS